MIQYTQNIHRGWWLSFWPEPLKDFFKEHNGKFDEGFHNAAQDESESAENMDCRWWKMWVFKTEKRTSDSRLKHCAWVSHKISDLRKTSKRLICACKNIAKNKVSIYTLCLHTQKTRIRIAYAHKLNKHTSCHGHAHLFEHKAGSWTYMARR